MKFVELGINKVKLPLMLRSLFPYKEKKLYIMPKNPLLYLLFHNKVSVVVINWAMQCMLGMVGVEIVIRLTIELLLILLMLLFIFDLSMKSFILAFLIAHTLNWIFNSHIVCTGRWIGITRTNKEAFFDYVESMRRRLINKKSIDSIILFGGISRGGVFKSTSDLDVRIIARHGLSNQIIACFYTIRERIISTLIWFPLDLYLATDHEQLRKLSKHETHFVIIDNFDAALNYYTTNNMSYFTYDDFLRIS
jgi:predicted nucleotidyltransferase